MTAMAKLGDLQKPFLREEEKDEDEDEDEGLDNNEGCLLDEYEILDVIGKGTYGVVCRALDKKTKEIVAMKEEVHGMCESTKTEINILKSLPRHPNIVQFKAVVTTGKKGGDCIFVVMEYMQYDLKKLMIKRRKNRLSLIEVKYLMEEIIKGVCFLHDHGIMHRDLKPSNILFSIKGAEVKFCDFGMAAPTTRRRYSHHVGTLWYKAPELLLGSRNYTCAVDMWAVGCIMAELVLNRVFFKGKSEIHQMCCIHKVFNPPFSLLRKKMALETSMLTPSGIDLLQRLLAYETHNRISARDALDHPWFAEFSA